MKRLAVRAGAAVLALVLPAVAFAAPRPTGGGGGGARPAAPASRPAPPVSRPAAPARPVTTSPGGFNFNRDVNVRPAPAPAIRRQVPTQPERQGQPPPAQQRQAQPPVQQRRAAPVVTGAGPYQSRFHGPIVRNPHRPPHNWEWNHGVVWVAAPIYWGGGFWGPWAVAALSTAVLFGTIVDYDNQVIYPSYQVQYDSPGAQLLADYGLQQTPCGPPDLVVIWGPGNAVICAYPNASVAAGNYEVDPATLTLTSESP